MKILIITDNMPDQINGVVTTYKNLAQQATQNGYYVSYITPMDFQHRMQMPLYKDITLAWPQHIGNLISNDKPVYIHIATEGPVGLAAKLYCDRNNLRYTTSYHTRFPEAIKQKTGIPESWSYKYFRWFHSRSHATLTTTDTMVQELIAKKFAPPVIPWSRGIDRSIFYPKPYRLPNRRPVLLYVGRISEEKNLRAFCELGTVAEKIAVGPGPDLERLQKEYPWVKFVGPKQGQALADYYRKADVFVFPSRWDTFGIVMIEAMACGTPVAAYPVPGPQDVITSDVDGYVNEILELAVYNCMMLDRRQVYESSLRWSWEKCWEIFRDHLVTAV